MLTEDRLLRPEIEQMENTTPEDAKSPEVSIEHLLEHVPPNLACDGPPALRAARMMSVAGGAADPLRTATSSSSAAASAPSRAVCSGSSGG